VEIDTKDLRLYTKLRIEELKSIWLEVLKNPDIKESHRERIRNIMEGRKKELKKINSLVSQGKLKQACKNRWPNYGDQIKSR
jgi:hypothetical protein